MGISFTTDVKKIRDGDFKKVIFQASRNHQPGPTLIL